MSTLWYRTRTVSDEYGYMKMVLFDDWKMKDVSSILLYSLYYYQPTTHFVRDI